MLTRRRCTTSGTSRWGGDHEEVSILRGRHPGRGDQVPALRIRSVVARPVNASCPFCSTNVPLAAQVCPACGDDISSSASREATGMADIKEIRTTYQSCQHVWHYLPGQKTKEVGETMQRAGCAIMTCGLASLFMKKPDNLSGQCPKCGSRAVKSEDVVHQV